MDLFNHNMPHTWAKIFNFECSRQFFNMIWRNQLKRLMDGKTQILELVEQAISAYDQREEWCSKLDALKEKASIDYRKHCMVSCINIYNIFLFP
jgi:hypothetical protein